jgi:hypothetical protein
MTRTTSVANSLGFPKCGGMKAALASELTSHLAFVGVSAVLFASATLTIV